MSYRFPIIPDIRTLEAITRIQRYQVDMERALRGSRALEDLANMAQRYEELARTFGGSMHADLQDRISRNALVPVATLGSPGLEAITAANASLVNLAAPSVIEQLSTKWAEMQRPWLDAFAVESTKLSGPDAPILASIAHISKLVNVSGAAEALLRQVEWERFVTAPSLPPGVGATLEDQFRSLAQAYAGLSAGLEAQISDLPPVVSELPPIEMYAGVHLVRTFSPSESEGEESEAITEAVALRDELERDTFDALEEGLTGLDPTLLNLWHGARAALLSKNPDRARHVAASLRELYTQILHRLAPDDAVRSWTSDPKHYEKGRPTRRVRHLFICRRINVGSFTTFVDLDVAWTLAFVDAFHAALHRIESNLSDDQLEALLFRMESLVRFLLRIGDVGH